MMMKDEFYPTPKELLDHIFESVDWKEIKNVLEPSAGKGDIVSYILERSSSSYYDNISVDCIEKDPDLQKILTGNGYRLVGDDFLTFKTYKRYDLIVMNPPFSDGDKHLLHAIELMKNGGYLICILNAETVRNPYSVSRQILAQKLEKLHADIEYMEGAFEEAERKTSVEIAVIKAVIPKKPLYSKIFNELQMEKKSESTIAEESEQTNLCDSDFVKAIVQQYEMETAAGIRLIEEYQAMKPLILTTLKKEDEKNPYAGKYALLELKCGKDAANVNDFVAAVRSKYWNALFADSRFTIGMTSNLVQDYREQIDKLADYDFSYFNIKTIQEDISRRLSSGVEECILKLFDELSFQYSWSDELSKNIHFYNGWKTNKAWIINEKVIIPGMRAWGSIFNNYDPDSYEIVQKFGDIEKALDYLAGNINKGNDRIVYTLREASDKEQTRNIDLKYFSVTFYKKGTCHIRFKNLELLKKLNIFGSQKKGWLPQDYGRKSYSEMTPEEKAVIDDFQGEKEYSMILKHKEQYLYQADNKLIGICQIS